MLFIDLSNLHQPLLVELSVEYTTDRGNRAIILCSLIRVTGLGAIAKLFSWICGVGVCVLLSVGGLCAEEVCLGVLM